MKLSKEQQEMYYNKGVEVRKRLIASLKRLFRRDKECSKKSG